MATPKVVHLADSVLQMVVWMACLTVEEAVDNSDDGRVVGWVAKTADQKDARLDVGEVALLASWTAARLVDEMGVHMVARMAV